MATKNKVLQVTGCQNKIYHEPGTGVVTYHQSPRIYASNAPVGFFVGSAAAIWGNSGCENGGQPTKVRIDEHGTCRDHLMGRIWRGMKQAANAIFQEFSP